MCRLILYQITRGVSRKLFERAVPSRRRPHFTALRIKPPSRTITPDGSTRKPKRELTLNAAKGSDDRAMNQDAASQSLVFDPSNRSISPFDTNVTQSVQSALPRLIDAAFRAPAFSLSKFQSLDGGGFSRAPSSARSAFITRST
jgi:hypothetical protein